MPEEWAVSEFPSVIFASLRCVGKHRNAEDVPAAPSTWRPCLRGTSVRRNSRLSTEFPLDREPIRSSVTTFGHYLQRGGSILTMSLGFALSAVQDEAGTKSTWSLIPS